ncbi:MAG: hypothetical protein GY940_25310 [bacterium]|nr:hypothetical protein [bacterium]
MNAHVTHVKVKSKEIDFKSLIIGFLLATVLFLTLGAYPGSGTQDVRIVGVYTSNKLNVSIREVNSSLEVPVKLKRVDSSIRVPVKIENQPIEVKTR